MDIKIIADTLDELQFSTSIPEPQTNLLIPGSDTVSLRVITASFYFSAWLQARTVFGMATISFRGMLHSKRLVRCLTSNCTLCAGMIAAIILKVLVK